MVELLSFVEDSPNSSAPNREPQPLSRERAKKNTIYGGARFLGALELFTLFRGTVSFASTVNVPAVLV